MAYRFLALLLVSGVYANEIHNDHETIKHNKTGHHSEIKNQKKTVHHNEIGHHNEIKHPKKTGHHNETGHHNKTAHHNETEHHNRTRHPYEFRYPNEIRTNESLYLPVDLCPIYPGEEFNQTAKQIREQKFRANRTLVVDMIPYEYGEKLNEKVEKIGNKLGILKPLEDVDSFFRLNISVWQFKDRPLPIVIRFRNQELRDVWNDRYDKLHLWMELWYLNNHLSEYL
uniref:Uncharacterized protein n=1 Tax=Cacopsylla melanoneura TaxID=428564 RepID=A0A8D9AXS3_9HEMI